MQAYKVNLEREVRLQACRGGKLYDALQAAITEGIGYK